MWPPRLVGHSWGDGSCDGLRWGLTSTAEPRGLRPLPSRASRTVTATLTQLSLGASPGADSWGRKLYCLDLPQEGGRGEEGKAWKGRANLTTLMCLTIGPSGDQDSH